MRSWILAGLGALVLGVVGEPSAVAAPLIDRPSVELRPFLQEARWVTRCRTAHVWRSTIHGRRLVPVRRCHRVRVRY